MILFFYLILYVVLVLSLLYRYFIATDEEKLKIAPGAPKQDGQIGGIRKGTPIPLEKPHAKEPFTASRMMNKRDAMERKQFPVDKPSSRAAAFSLSLWKGKRRTYIKGALLRVALLERKYTHF